MLTTVPKTEFCHHCYFSSFSESKLVVISAIFLKEYIKQELVLRWVILKERA